MSAVNAVCGVRKNQSRREAVSDCAYHVVVPVLTAPHEACDELGGAALVAVMGVPGRVLHHPLYVRLHQRQERHVKVPEQALCKVNRQPH